MSDLESKIITVKKEIRSCKSEKRRRDLEKHLRKLENAKDANYKKGKRSWDD